MQRHIMELVAKIKQYNWLFRLCVLVYILIVVLGVIKGNIGIGLVFLAFGSVLMMATKK